MRKKLFVSNLSNQVTEGRLKELFTKAGEVISAKIVIDHRTGHSRGFGFVDMETKREGHRAISMINGRMVDGRALAVNEAGLLKGSLWQPQP